MKSFCNYCDKEFKHSFNKKGMYCCRKCYELDRRISQKKCVFCGKSYVPDRGSLPRWENSKYCSDICARKGRKHYFVCENCNKSFYRKPCKAKKSKHKFCSNKCYQKFFTKKILGSKQYKKGRRAEYECTNILRKRGFFLIIRSRRSLGVFDVISLGSEDLGMKLIQVKYDSDENWRESKYKKDLDAILNIKGLPRYCSKELWVKTPHKGWKIKVLS